MLCRPTANGVSLLASSNGKVRQTPVPSPPPSHASSDETLEAAALYEELASAAACGEGCALSQQTFSRSQQQSSRQCC